MISIEEELIKAQIAYIDKEIYLIKDMYFTNSEYDLDYFKIITEYEEKLNEKEYILQEQLEIYKQFYTKCLELLFAYKEETDGLDEEVEYIKSEVENDYDEENPF